MMVYNIIKNMDKPRKITTLCLVCDYPNILLGLKKRGFGKGRWNGFGGKVLDGETIEDATIREVKEECHIEVTKLEKFGFLEFDAPHFDKIVVVHMFCALDFSGEPQESEEMKPQWFHIDEMPLESMWPDDIYWYPLFCQNKKFKGRFLFNENEDIVDYSLYPVKELN